ncbi:MAG: TPM domain-containing protein [Candidatus Cloacimonetes bacterium]|nr:TPM domain-containing protein [Candidatus Cloacimonadota bacterium]
MNKFFKILLLLAATALFSNAYALGYPVQDDANLLNPSTKKTIEEISSDLYSKTKTSFLFKSFEKDSLKSFDSNCANVFALWIRNTNQARGVMIYLEVDKKTRQGRINFSCGYGIRGAFKESDVQSILKNKIMAFQEDVTQQKLFIEGVREISERIQIYFDGKHHLKYSSLKDHSSQVLSKDKIVYFLVLFLVCFFITALILLYSKGRCPRCNSRAHINIRPLMNGDSRYKRMKIVKCFECNYFKKYLF